MNKIKNNDAQQNEAMRKEMKNNGFPENPN